MSKGDFNTKGIKHEKIQSQNDFQRNYTVENPPEIRTQTSVSNPNQKSESFGGVTVTYCLKH